MEADETNCSSQDSIEVEIVSEEEFEAIDAAIQEAAMQGYLISFASCFIYYINLWLMT